MRRVTSVLAAAGVALAGYGVLDVVDVAPGGLTRAPLATVTPSLPRPSGVTATTPAPDPSGMPVRPVDDLAAVPSPAGLAGALAPALADPALAGSSVVVRDGLTGATLFERDPATPRVPASTAKLLSALAVAQTFPEGSVFTTSVRAGTAPDRVVLVAGGDTLLAPNAGAPDAVAGRAGLGDLADQVAAALRARAGGPPGSVLVQVDGSYATGPATAPAWPTIFRSAGIAGTVAPLGLATQRIQLGRPAVVDPVAETAQAFAARLTERGVTARYDPTAPPVAPTTSPPTGPTVALPTGPTVALPTGPTGAPGVPSTVPPTLVPGATGAAGPTGVLGSVRSAPVAQVLALALQDSDNTLTESLARSAAVRSGRPGDFAAVGEFVRAAVAGAGVDTTGVRLADASGLDPTDTAPARVLADVLVLATTGRAPALATALLGLPVAGLTGTLGDRFAGTGARPGLGWVRAKTGTLTGVNTLAGLVTTAQGRLLVFAVLQQGGAGTPVARAALDRFAATLATCGCR